METQQCPRRHSDSGTVLRRLFANRYSFVTLGRGALDCTQTHGQGQGRILSSEPLRRAQERLHWLPAVSEPPRSRQGSGSYPEEWSVPARDQLPPWASRNPSSAPLTPTPVSPSLWPQACEPPALCRGSVPHIRSWETGLPLSERGPRQAEGVLESPELPVWLTTSGVWGTEAWLPQGLEARVTPSRGHLSPHPGHYVPEAVQLPQAQHPRPQLEPPSRVPSLTGGALPVPTRI